MEFLRINNRKNFLLKEVPNINPYSRKYLSFWREQRRRCISGIWSIDDANVSIDLLPEKPTFPKSNNWRYMPPVCYFYVNFGTIMDNKKGATSGAKIPIRPRLDDIEWEFNYNWLEARGFSGFVGDEEYSCNIKLLDEDLDDAFLINLCKDNDGEILSNLYGNFFKKNGKRKQYVNVKTYLRQLHSKPLGDPVYANLPKNMMILGTRDGGKSYLGGSVISHELTFDGMRDYERNPEVMPRAEIIVGAAISDKSRDLLMKAQETMDNLPGGWKKGSVDQVPSPFFKHMKGSLQANKEWKHEYSKYNGGEEEKIKGSFVKHRVFTSENAEAAAGGRPVTIIVDEVGLMTNLLIVHGSNVAAQNSGGHKFGSTLYTGTAGNVEKIAESEIMFNDPVGFDLVEFDNIWESESLEKIGWFIPATHMTRSFKDENGNTMIKEATKHFLKDREKKSKAASRKALDLAIMNYPLVPSEMFVNADTNIFPVADIKGHYSRLMANKNLLDVSYKGRFELTSNGRAEWSNTKSTPIREYPMKKSDSSTINGCIEIFEMPIKNFDGIINSNVYIAGYDPIDDDDDSDVTRSLQSFWIMNALTERLVLEYTGRTELASTFYEQCRRALLFYNAKVNYENNKKGFYGHMFNKAGLQMLCPTPDILIQKDMQKSRGVGNKSLGTNMSTVPIIKYGEELLLKWLISQAYDKEPGVMNLHTIKSPALLKELIAYNPKGNFDRISALFTLMIIKEDKLKIIKHAKAKVKRTLDDVFFDVCRGSK